MASAECISDIKLPPINKGLCLNMKYAKLKDTEYCVNKKKKLGVGSFCSVLRAVNVNTGFDFACRVSNVQRLKHKKKIKNLQLEYEIHKKCVHPNIVYHYDTFTDGFNVYTFVEFCPGGDLIDLFCYIGGVIPEIHAIFYIAEIIASVKALHDYGYIHRDLKPDNILLDKNGHIKLTDFNLAIPIEHVNKEVCGAFIWRSPEMVMRKSYSELLDYWNVGGIFYEMLVGLAPFDSDHMNSLNQVQKDYIRKKIKNCDYKKRRKSLMANIEDLLKVFPKTFVYDNNTLPISIQARDLIKHLLCLPHKRYGFKQIQNHKLFEDIDFSIIHHRTPPLIPDYHVQR